MNANPKSLSGLKHQQAAQPSTEAAEVAGAAEVNIVSIVKDAERYDEGEGGMVGG